MGKLFNFIKNRYQKIKEFDQLKKDDFTKSRGFDIYREAYINYYLIQNVISKINNKSEEFLGDKFKDFINKNNGALGIDANGIVLPNIDSDLIDIEDSLNKLEAELNDNQIEELLEASDEVIRSNTLEPLHVFSGLMKKIKKDLDELNPTNEEISEEEKKEIVDSLDFANTIIVENRNGGIYDDIIDDLSDTKTNEDYKLTEFANKIGVKVEDINEVNYGNNKISISFNRVNHYDKFAPVVNLKIKLTDEYKNKIKALDNYISQKSIIKNPVFGETGLKEYAFNDWFSKADELKKEIVKNYKLNNDQREEKIASYKKIIALKKDVENITNEYKDVMNFIKTNFDVNKIAFPGNIYSGRNFKLGDAELEDFKLNLPKIFDEENAGYSVILNGYGQLKGFINQYGVTLDEILDDPVNTYFKICSDRSKQIDQQFIMPREGNTLGKRMARLLYQPERKYDYLAQVFMGERAIEFLVKTQDFDENTFDNRMIDIFSSNLSNMLDHQSVNLFGADPSGNSEIKKLFAFGDNVDNLLTVSSQYRTLETINTRNPNEFNYENKIHEMRNVNPAVECRRVLDILKDYFKERTYLYNHEDQFCDPLLDETFSNRFEPARMILAAKEYFEDYIYKNDINVSHIRDDEERKLVIDFLCNPADVLEEKFSNEPDLCIIGKQENLKKYHDNFKTLMVKIHAADFNNFNTNFNLHNQKPNGFNTNKGMMTILRDNSGSKWEKFFKSTSPEYKTLVSSLYAALDPECATCGDFSFVKYCAKKYLEHKLPDGTNENKVSETGRRRIEFCRTILNALNDLPDKFKEVSQNQPVADLAGPSIGNIAHNHEDNNDIDFQNQIKEDLENNNQNDEIKNEEENIKEEIEIKNEEEIVKENTEIKK